MRKLLLPAIALLALSACNNKAKNEAAEANEQVAGDSNTMGEAVSDVNAAENSAFEAAESNYDQAVPAGEDSGDENSNEITD